jgi:cytochrome c-type biogenesis protein CcmH
MKQIIRTRLAEGKTEQQIKDELVAQFGAGVLAEPPKSGLDLLAWLVPLTVLGAGAVGGGALAWGWSRRRAEDGAPAAVDPELDHRLDDELDRYDR